MKLVKVSILKCLFRYNKITTKQLHIIEKTVRLVIIDYVNILQVFSL